MLSEDVKIQIDTVISNSKNKKVWDIYEEAKKVIHGSYDYLEGIKYIVEKLGV